ncbi:MAG: hypothetical protein CL910_10630 [Deltaproteobacteria bacterium]|jgi:RsiW-degrading membrane proteinase PrsW (M82 family)|nr:hypothetical protein [Deltaproteobacteria bacterium]
MRSGVEGLDRIWLLALPAVAAAAGAWIAYLRWKDRHRPEPWVLLASALLLGALAVAAASSSYDLLDRLGALPTWEQLMGPWRTAWSGAMLIGAVEEAAKMLPVLPLAFGSRHFDELWDGPVYAGAAGIGFALAEALALVSQGELGAVETLARAGVAPLSHALFAAPWGLGLAYATLAGRWLAWPAGFVAAVVAHGAYDLCMARPGLQIFGALLVGGLCIGWIAAARVWART